MGRLQTQGIEVYDASKNQLRNPHVTEAAGILQSTIGTIVDTTEQVTRSRNVVTGQTTKARKGSYLNGPIAYGVGIQCVTQDGTIRWTSEMVGKTLYETIYTDGRVTILLYAFCGDRVFSDKLLFCRSRYNDKIWVGKVIFRSYLAGSGAREIIGSLNSSGHRLPGGRVFYKLFIYNVRGNGHIYMGSVAYFKANSGRCYHGNKITPIRVKNFKGVLRRKTSLMIGLLGRRCSSLLLVLLYRVQTRRNLFQWLSLDFLQFLVPASFVDMLQTSRCRRLSEKIGVSSRAPKKWVDPRAQAPCRANSS